MKASVAPISLETSISSRWVRIWRRMVLKVTATRPIPSSALKSQIARRPIAASAVRRRAQGSSERLGVRALRLGRQEHRDLRVEGEAAGDRAQAFEQRVAARRERKG